MHQPDGDNILTDENGDSWFQDGPPASTLKANFLNAVKGELINILKAYGITPKTPGSDTYDQIAQALIARDQGKTREASIVIASSDSDENARLTADVVISTATDAAAILNAQMVALSATGGGKIFVRKGTYNIYTDLKVKHKTNLVGEGEGTLIVSPVLLAVKIQPDSNTASCTISDISVYGAIIQGLSSNYCTWSNVRVQGTGYFNSCNNLINCTAIQTPATVGQYGFIYCKSLTNCVVDNVLIGFSNCINLTGCSADCKNVIDGIENDIQIGFSSCINLTGCSAFGNSTYGYELCRDLADCVAEYCLTGFYDCKHISSCYANNNTNGYHACGGVVNCRAYKNTAFGFNMCTACLGLYALSHGSAGTSFQVCSPNWTLGGSAVANNTLGGCNHYVL